MANYNNILINLLKKAYNKNMFATNTATCMLLFGIGDGITQYIESTNNNNNSNTTNNNNNTIHSSNVISNGCGQLTTANAAVATHSPSTNLLAKLFTLTPDWTRTGKMVVMGSVIGPLGHLWYTFLDRKFPKKSASVILRKIFIDQLCFAPFLNVVFITGLHLLEGERLDMLKSSLKEKLLPLYAYDCMIWPPAQLLNFYFISPQHRVLYVNIVTLLWNCVSSFIMYNDVSLHSTFE